MTDSELLIARQRVEPLLQLARANIDRLCKAVGDAGCCILLSNADGVTVDRRGNLTDNRHFDNANLCLGSVRTEKVEGTNAIGTCLVEQKPVAIHRDQHYLLRNASLSGTAAPIFDHMGTLMATINISSLRPHFDESYLALLSIAVGETARRIEVEWFRSIFSGNRIVFPPLQKCPANALLAVNDDDLVIGATRAARVLMGNLRATLDKPFLAPMLIQGVTSAPIELVRAEQGALHRALANSGGNVTAAAKSLGISRATFHRKLKKTRK